MFFRELLSPFVDNGKAILREENTEQEFRGEKYPLKRYYYHCEESDLEFTIDEQDEFVCEQIALQFKERHPEEAKSNPPFDGYYYKPKPFKPIKLSNIQKLSKRIK